jgi:hypothetical protein
MWLGAEGGRKHCGGGGLGGQLNRSLPKLAIEAKKISANSLPSLARLIQVKLSRLLAPTLLPPPPRDKDENPCKCFLYKTAPKRNTGWNSRIAVDLERNTDVSRDENHKATDERIVSLSIWLLCWDRVPYASVFIHTSRLNVSWDVTPSRLVDR